MRSNVSPARLLRWIPRLLLIAAVTLVFIYPFWWMMVNSLNTNAQVFGPPRAAARGWRWQNYVEICQKQPVARHYANTLLVAGVGTLGNVLISALRQAMDLRGCAFRAAGFCSSCCSHCADDAGGGHRPLFYQDEGCCR